MSTLDAYLVRKQGVLAERQSDYRHDPAKAIVRLQAKSWVAGDTGARPVRLGETVFVTDAAPGLAGHGLGPTAPELLLGALASCLVHTYLIQAALLAIPIDHIAIDVRGELDMTGVVGLPAASLPQLAAVTYSTEVTSSAPAAQIAVLHAAVDDTCPVLNTLRLPTPVQRQRN